MSEIKLLFCALAGCTSHKTMHPEIALCTLPICSNSKWHKKRAHTGCTPLKIMHPAVEMCTPGAWCTLNFGHCLDVRHCWKYVHAYQNVRMSHRSWSIGHEMKLYIYIPVFYFKIFSHKLSTASACTLRLKSKSFMKGYKKMKKNVSSLNVMNT